MRSQPEESASPYSYRILPPPHLDKSALAKLSPWAALEFFRIEAWLRSEEVQKLYSEGAGWRELQKYQMTGDELQGRHHHYLTPLRLEDSGIVDMDYWNQIPSGSAKHLLNPIAYDASRFLSHAMEDGLAQANVSLKPGKFLPKIPKRHNITPLTRAEVARLLDVTKARLPRYFPLFLCAVWTGLRMGELLALQWGDVDWQGRFLEIQRNYTRLRLITTQKRRKPTRGYVV